MVSSVRGITYSPTIVQGNKTIDRTKVTTDLKEFIGGSGGVLPREFRIPGVLTEAQVDSGLNLNRLERVQTGGSNHFPGWWGDGKPDLANDPLNTAGEQKEFKGVAADTEIVVVQGAAFKGQSVNLGGENIRDAGVVYVRRNAGFSNTNVTLDVPGKDQEVVSVYYVRMAPNGTMNMSADGKNVSFSGNGAWVGGDRWQRHMQLTIEVAPDEKPVVSQQQFVHHNKDSYGWNVQGKKDRQLGGHIQSWMFQWDEGKKSCFVSSIQAPQGWTPRS